MPSSINAITSAGRPVSISPLSVSALMPDLVNHGRTMLIVDGETLSTEGGYEDWMRLFASEWSERQQ